MRYLINFYNQASAGTSMLARTFLDYLHEAKDADDEFIIILPWIYPYKNLNFKQKNGVKIVYVPFFHGIRKIIFRCYFDVFIFPLMVLFVRPHSVLVFGNYAPVPLCSNKIVLCHHPHLVDDELLSKYHFRTKLLERLKRFLFFLTVHSCKNIVVESYYMKNELMHKYAISENSICVIRNSISESLLKHQSELGMNTPFKERKSILYVSRFSLHKNFNFLLALAQKYRKDFEIMNLEFNITIDINLNKEANKLIDDIKAWKLEHIIKNLGELSQERLVRYYQESLCLFFPSSAETFGIPLIEAMFFKLPIILPGLPYAYSMCDGSALYYDPDNCEAAFKKICYIYSSENNWKIYSDKSSHQFSKYPTSEEWVKKYLNLLKG